MCPVIVIIMTMYPDPVVTDATCPAILAHFSPDQRESCYCDETVQGGAAFK